VPSDSIAPCDRLPSIVKIPRRRSDRQVHSRQLDVIFLSMARKSAMHCDFKTARPH